MIVIPWHIFSATYNGFSSKQKVISARSCNDRRYFNYLIPWLINLKLCVIWYVCVVIFVFYSNFLSLLLQESLYLMLGNGVLKLKMIELMIYNFFTFLWDFPKIFQKLMRKRVFPTSQYYYSSRFVLVQPTY